MAVLRRRQFLQWAAAAVLTPRIAWAENYPVRPARIVSGFPPGGINDTYARLIGQWLSDHLGQQFIVENRSGAGGNLAAETVARAAPDGYTLLLTTSADAWNATLYQNLNFNITRDFAPVATVSRSAGVLVVNPSVSARTVPELLADAKSNPGRITVASAGVGSAPHMYWEMFHSMTGVDMVHVPYRGGGPAVADLLGGQVQVYFGTNAAVIGYIRAGRLRPLAVTGATRTPTLPEVPALAEFLPGYEASIYVGIAAPRDTPPAAVDTLAGEINRMVTDPTMKDRIAAFGDSPLPLTTGKFAELVATEADKWGKVIQSANIRAE